MRLVCGVILLAPVILCGSLMAQSKATAAQTKTVACTFQDGSEMSIRYRPEPTGKKDKKDKKKLREGEVWSPGGSPMYLFMQTNVTLAGTLLPAGAYSMYLIPAKEHWTLIVNKNVKEGTAYDATQDVVRVPMSQGELGHAQGFRVYLGQSGPKQCSIRVYHGKTGSWADFNQQ